MAAYNQGWAIRCDDCGDNLFDSIHGGKVEGPQTRADVERDARDSGWLVTRSKCVCSECRKEMEGTANAD